MPAETGAFFLRVKERRRERKRIKNMKKVLREGIAKPPGNAYLVNKFLVQLQPC